MCLIDNGLYYSYLIANHFLLIFLYGMYDEGDEEPLSYPATPLVEMPTHMKKEVRVSTIKAGKTHPRLTQLFYER